MYLQPYVWHAGGRIIGLSDKNEMCTSHDENSTYNETVCLSPTLSLLHQYLVLVALSDALLMRPFLAPKKSRFYS